MHRVPFSILVATTIAGLALLAVVTIAGASYGLLQRSADEQALERARSAADRGARALESAADELSSAADRLGEHAALEPWTPSGERAPLAAFLETVRATRLAGSEQTPTACAVTRTTAPHGARADGGVLASAGPEQPWPAIALTAGDPMGISGSPARLRVVRAADGDPTLFASAPVPAAPNDWARAALTLDSALAARLMGNTAGLEIRLLARGSEPPEGEARALLRDRAFAAGTPASAHLGSDDRYVAVRPLSGILAGFFIEAAVPAAEVRQAMSTLASRLTTLALVIASLASLAGMFIGRRLAEPINRLTDSATRLGAGDLETPIAQAPGAELAVLAEGLEDMRRRLREQTAELGRRQAESAAVLSGIAEGVFSVDRDRRIGYLNPQAAALLGIAPEAALGAFCGDVLKPAAVDGVRPCESQCPIVHARSRGSARAVEPLTLVDGTHRSVVITSSPPAAGLQFQVLRDETDSEAARRLRDVVFANISHEFKTPLSAQLASIELLSDQLGRSGDRRSLELVQSLERGTLRLTQLVDNLLESVRIEAGSLSIRRRALALDEVIEQAVELTSPLFEQRQQRIELELPYPLPNLQGDGPRLAQVFVNLLANANKYAPTGSTIRIGGRVGTGSVGLWVEDEGPGLPDTTGRSLFARFVRSADEDEPEQSGMGLGLWIAQSIAERHGGKIDTERIDGRTRITLHLPYGELWGRA
ncbi:MAG: ATP-binding protein [Acidobacteriota bacterium]